MRGNNQHSLSQCRLDLLRQLPDFSKSGLTGCHGIVRPSRSFESWNEPT